MKQNLIWSKRKDRRIDAKKAGNIENPPNAINYIPPEKVFGLFFECLGASGIERIQSNTGRQTNTSKQASQQTNEQTNK